MCTCDTTGHTRHAHCYGCLTRGPCWECPYYDEIRCTECGDWVEIGVGIAVDRDYYHPDCAPGEEVR